MYIYNVTINIDETVHGEWLKWMQETHIPDILATGKFLNARLVKVMADEEMGGETYALQCTANSRELLDLYYEEDADRLRGETNRLFADKFVAFRTELLIISEH